MTSLSELAGEIFKAQNETDATFDYFYGYGYFTTNEYDYPDVLKKIKVKGGIHVAVMGGLDPVLGQIAIAKPDYSIVSDINPLAIQAIEKGRLECLKHESEKEYWDCVSNYFTTVIKAKETNRWDFPTDQAGEGWSSFTDRFLEVKEYYQSGKIKLVHADFINTAFTSSIELARRTNNKITLIYVSNIFDYKANDLQKFINLLQNGLDESLIDDNAQIIFTDGKRGLESNILLVKTYIENFKNSN